jgi:hypothetical protein
MKGIMPLNITGEGRLQATPTGITMFTVTIGTQHRKNCVDKSTRHMQVMWAFQLIGKAASNADNNFDDWSFNSSQWWDGVNQNLAGGGTPNMANPKGKALVEG